MQNKSIPNCKTKQERIAFWYPIYKASLTSNLTQVKFCAQYNISDASLYRWSKYFEKHSYISQSSSKVNSTTSVTTKTTGKKQTKAKSAFLPVAITDLPPTKMLTKQPNDFALVKEVVPPIELLFPNGVKLIFKQGGNVNLLMQLITAMGA